MTFGLSELPREGAHEILAGDPPGDVRVADRSGTAGMRPRRSRRS
jgi:hypothetical protein